LKYKKWTGFQQILAGISGGVKSTACADAYLLPACGKPLKWHEQSSAQLSHEVGCVVRCRGLQILK